MLQALCDLLDAQAADAVKFDLRWKVACGVAAHAGFDPSTLVYWRRRLG